MTIAAVFLILFILVLPQNPPTTTNTPESLQNPINPDIFQNNEKSVPPAISKVNAYSIFKIHDMDPGIIPVNPSSPSPDINKIIGLFNSYVENLFKDSLIPGSAVVVTYKDKIVYMKTLGVKKVGESDPINLDTIFEIGSCTKAFTATAIASLVDKNIMSWNDLAKLYYPDPAVFELYNTTVSDEINMKDLLSHRSGLPPHAGTYHILDFWYDFNETLPHLRYLPPEGDFRTHYAYQNILFSLAGYSSAKAAGITWDELMKQEIFQPLKMGTSVTTLQEFLNNPNHASNHEIDENGQVHYREPLYLDPMGPAMTISSSIKDLGNWLLFQTNNGQFNGQQIVSKGSLAETKKMHILIDQQPTYTTGYGLGWGVTQGDDINIVSHTGSTVYSRGYAALYPDDQLGIMIVANEGNRGGTFGEMLANMLHLIYKTGKLPDGSLTTSYPTANGDVLIEPSYEKLPEILSSNPLPYPIENYVGNYFSDYWGTIKIEKKDANSLSLYPGENPNPITLSHYSSNTFNESDHHTEVTFSDFVAGQSQKVVAKRWEVYGSNGTFNRV